MTEECILNECNMTVFAAMLVHNSTAMFTVHLGRL